MGSRSVFDLRTAAPARAIWLLASLWLAACSGPPPGLPALAPDATLLAFGDSLTRGTGATEAQSYPARLQDLTGRRVINAGVPGEVSADGARRLPGLLDRHAPDLLLLCHGGNDMLRRFDPAATEASLRAMIDAAGERGVPVVLLGVPRPGLLLSTPGLYTGLAEEYGLPYDGAILPEILGDRDLKSDSIHPNAAGYQRLAQAVHALLMDNGAL